MEGLRDAYAGGWRAGPGSNPPWTRRSRFEPDLVNFGSVYMKANSNFFYTNLVVAIDKNIVLYSYKFNWIIR